MTAYYNEIDPYAAQWIRNLIAAGHIAPGVVDERSIEDLLPSDLTGYTQCHFFAGIGVWSYALRRAGWPDDRPVWTGSCPCQPFSAAGAGKGFTDERHLWPAFNHLIAECRPECVIGEQVASKDADTWLDLVQADLEGLGYAFGAIPFPSASVGAPHIRDRLYWLADSTVSGSAARGASGQYWPQGANRSSGSGEPCGLGNNNNTRLEGLGRGHQAEGGRVGTVRPVTEASESRGMAPPRSSRLSQLGGPREEPSRPASARGLSNPGPTNGFWRDVDWLGCRDGKWRPVEPCTFPLAHGASARVGRLRAYGNAINAEAAIAFIECYLDSFDNLNILSAL